MEKEKSNKRQKMEHETGEKGIQKGRSTQEGKARQETEERLHIFSLPSSYPFSIHDRSFQRQQPQATLQMLCRAYLDNTLQSK